MDYDNHLKSIQQIINQGFMSQQISDINWMNNLCGELVNLFKAVQKHLVFETDPESGQFERFFLYAAQIICCIKNMEKMVVVELEKEIVLSSTRRYFLDRINFCTTKITNLENDVRDDLNLISLTDSVLEMIELMLSYKIENCENVALQDVEMMTLSVNIRAEVELMISHSLGFANVLNEIDKSRISLLCQKVLRECIALEEEHSVEKPSRNYSNQRIRAESLEFSVCKLEKLINDCLLQLLYEVFTAVDKDHLSKFDKNSTEEDINAFDHLNDCLLQIGIFAVTFSQDFQSRSKIRSNLASLESLDTHLVPSILSGCQIHSSLLAAHWRSTVGSIRFDIQKMIDTHPFCQSLLEIVQETIKMSQKNIDNSKILDCLSKCEIFLEHYHINVESIRCADNIFELNKFEKDFRMMIAECRSSINPEFQVSHDRIVKRLKILKSIISTVLPNFATSNETKVDMTDKFTFDSEMDNLKDSNKFFNSLGIKPKETSILYKVSESMLPVTSKGDQKTVSCVTFRSRKKRMSLRMAMFKNQQCIETKEIIDSIAGKYSVDLHITEILDQLTVSNVSCK